MKSKKTMYSKKRVATKKGHTIESQLLEAANRISAYHEDADPALEKVLYLPRAAGSKTETVRLIEVSNAASFVGYDIYAVSFDAAPEHDVDFPSEVVLLHPQEYADIVAGKLQLPKGWNLDRAVTLFEKSKNSTANRSSPHHECCEAFPSCADPEQIIKAWSLSTVFERLAVLESRIAELMTICQRKSTKRKTTATKPKQKNRR